ncbi:MAG: asparagine synthase (glutamine-hydrolyzing) [Xanthomonadales bacterium]|nr:asparagine synthase (glutamine-hydrolyzing) [Xanthomonadales bacterium]MCC6561966.1 asparagine synthase (glutamine-hydrolyzing) [Xanthomonadales bacterium]
MCGIFGTVGREDHRGLRDAALTLKHRGPDGFGEWTSPDRDVYLAHCRLKIIDLSEAGRQPMANEDGSIQLTFNGEIYNFLELRKELEAVGHRFASKSDSEVIVHGYEQWGAEVVRRLRGIFAFAVWDHPRRRLLLARDHLGVKPLYYAIHGSELIFASEPRALLPLMKQDRVVDQDGLFDFLRLGYVAGSRSIWQGISRLPAASTLLFERVDARATIQRFWSLPQTESVLSEGEAVDRADALVASAVGEQMVSDVPIGLFLSGGIDSSLIAAYANRGANAVDSFFVDFGDWGGSERGDAEAAAMHVGTRHHVDEIDPATLAPRTESDARLFFSAFDEPIADQSLLPTWHLARKTRRHVTVTLSGDGGDELFCGYSWYRQVKATPRRRLAWLVEGWRRRLGLGRQWPQGCAGQDEYYHLLHFPSFGLHELVQLFPSVFAARFEHRGGIPEQRHNPWSPRLTKHWQHVDIHSFLVDSNLARVDRASMAHGLEVRVPLLDHRIAEFAMSLPPALLESGDQGKPLLRRLAARNLPGSLCTKPKQGFSFPWHRLIEQATIHTALRNGSLVRLGLLDRAGLERWLGTPAHELKLWLLFVLENWSRNWLAPEFSE